MKAYLAAIEPKHASRDRRSEREESGGKHGRLRHHTPRCVDAPQRQNLHDVSSEKPPRCVVGSHLLKSRLSHLGQPFRRLAQRLGGTQSLLKTQVTTLARSKTPPLRSVRLPPASRPDTARR
jgi:hypothetical protein